MRYVLNNIRCVLSPYIQNIICKILKPTQKAYQDFTKNIKSVDQTIPWEIEMIQKEIATPSCGCKKASAGLATGFVLDIGAPMADENLRTCALKEITSI